jgi:hypothetical protein
MFCFLRRSRGFKHVPLSLRSLILHAYVERWVQSVKDKSLARMRLFGEGARRCVLNEYVDHEHHERHHQGKSNVLSFLPSAKARYVPALFDAVDGLDASSNTTSMKLHELVGPMGCITLRPSPSKARQTLPDF